MTNTTGTGMAPFLLIGGTMEKPQPSDVAIIAENRAIFEAMGLVDVLDSMVFLYYICNLEYPKECANTFIVIQRMIMNVYDT